MNTSDMDNTTIKDQIRAFIADNFLFGRPADLSDATSFLEAGILDSTGILQLIAFLGETFDIAIGDEEVTPDNLDSIEKASAYVLRKRTASLPLSAGATS